MATNDIYEQMYKLELDLITRHLKSNLKTTFEYSTYTDNTVSLIYNCCLCDISFHANLLTNYSTSYTAKCFNGHEVKFQYKERQLSVIPTVRDEDIENFYHLRTYHPEKFNLVQKFLHRNRNY